MQSHSKRSRKEAHWTRLCVGYLQANIYLLISGQNLNVVGSRVESQNSHYSCDKSKCRTEWNGAQRWTLKWIVGCSRGIPIHFEDEKMMMIVWWMVGCRQALRFSRNRMFYMVLCKIHNMLIWDWKCSLCPGWAYVEPYIKACQEGKRFL